MHQFVMAEPIWKDHTGFIIAGGPSLRGFDFSRLAGRKVLAINSSVFSYLDADALFFGDARWWVWNCKELKKKYRGHIFTSSEIVDARVSNLVKRKPAPHITMDRGQVVMQRTSLTAALNLLVHFGCNRIVLLGADQKPAADGTTHHHEPHPVPSLRNCYDIQMKELRETARPLADLGIEVINTSLESRIDWWPKQSIEELL